MGCASGSRRQSSWSPSSSASIARRSSPRWRLGPEHSAPVMPPRTGCTPRQRSPSTCATTSVAGSASFHTPHFPPHSLSSLFSFCLARRSGLRAPFMPGVRWVNLCRTGSSCGYRRHQALCSGLAACHKEATSARILGMPPQSAPDREIARRPAGADRGEA